MTRARTAARSGTLTAMLMMGACGPSDQASAPRTTPRPAVPVHGPDLALDRLRWAPGAQPTPAATGRNPFRFGGAGRSAESRLGRSKLAPLPPPDGLPELPLPLAQPPLRLLGLVTLADGGKVAVISVGGDLMMARVGDVIANRFRVKEIGQDSVDLVDAVGDRPIRLALP